MISQKLKRVANYLIYSNFKRLILIIFFIALTYLIFSLKTILDNSNQNQTFINLENLFNFSNPNYKARNFIFLINFAMLVFTFIYCLFSAYSVWKYSLNIFVILAISIIFIILGLAGLRILFSIPITFDTGKEVIINNSVLIIIALFLNLIVQTGVIIWNRKKNPIDNKSNLMLLSGSFIRFLIVIFGITLLYIFISKTNESAIANKSWIDVLFTDQNSNFRFFDNNLNVVINRYAFLYILIIVLLSLFSIVLSFWPYFSNKNNEQKVKFILKSLFNFVLCASVSLIIFATKHLGMSLENNFVFVTKKIQHIYYLIFIGSYLIILVTLISLFILSKDKMKKINLNRFLISLSFFFLVSLCLSIRFVQNEPFINLIVLILLNAFIASGMVASRFIENVKKSKSFLLTNTLVLILTLFAVFFQTLDIIISVHNNNLLSSIFIFIVHISDIFLISALIIIFAGFVYQIYEWSKLLFYIKRNDLRVGKERKREKINVI
ncbi:hypothetical protein C4M96_01715 [Mycoplasmopsis pullorum]|uniref:MSC_0624 family F1-like ATPase-associated membrane protein n=1 Tax=Mycoplasmopsis pullorum TaxID=48003 RepID=UPI003A7F32D0|nr:hypothetical protein C4M96_01715 [Mycoplasmopsis pullorum]